MSNKVERFEELAEKSAGESASATVEELGQGYQGCADCGGVGAGNMQRAADSASAADSGQLRRVRQGARKSTRNYRGLKR